MIKSSLFFLLVLFMPAVGYLQEIDAPGLQVRVRPAVDGASPGLSTVREGQDVLGKAEDVMIKYKDDHLLSLSAIDGVPIDFRDNLFANVTDAITFIPELYPYFGFTGTESLVFNKYRKDDQLSYYYFDELINELRTTRSISLIVDGTTNKLTNIVGNVVLDRGFQKIHKFSRQEAIESVLKYIRLNGKSFREEGNHSAYGFYKAWGLEGGIAPWWAVNIDGSNIYYISPDGVIDDSSGVTTLP